MMRSAAADDDAAADATRRLAADQRRIVTSERERFVFVEDGAPPDRRPVVAVTCESNLRVLCGFLPLYADTAPGRCAPAHFGPTYVVHAYNNGLYAPLVYLLLADGDGSERYARAWRFLARLCRSHGLVFSPDTVRVEVDRDARDAVRSVFPWCAVRACRFHLGRAWRARLDRDRATASLLRRPRRDAEPGQWLRALTGLSYLPPAEVPDAFSELVAIAPAHRGAHAFSDHVLENYVEDDDGGGGTPWPPDTWAEAPAGPSSASAGPESFHRHLARQFAAFEARPSVMKVIKVLKKIQTETYMKINYILRPAGWHADVCSDEMKRIWFASENYSKYVNGEISRLEYVITMGCGLDGLAVGLK